MSAPTVRPYTGNMPYVTGLLNSARTFMHTDLCGAERQLWKEYQAAEVIKQNLPAIRQHLADMQRFVREIETILTTVEEQQNAAKEDHSRAA